MPPPKGQSIWTETTIWTFTGADDGCNPTGLLSDATGVIYGVAETGGSEKAGTAFALTPPAHGQSAWTEQTLWAFKSGTDGNAPASPPIAGKNGVLYGTTLAGGSASTGTAYSLAPPANGQGAWTETILWNFTDGGDGAGPASSPLLDKTGSLYGTVELGGGAQNAGAAYRLTPPAPGKFAWTETTLWAFSNGSDGGHPEAALIPDGSGNLYGTAPQSAPGGGVVFRLAGTGFVPN